MPKFLSTDEIRRRFIAFYVSKGHKHVPADSLVPQNDKSVLFTGAGMNQFKDHFLGRAKIDHPRQRAVTVQPCVRTADIENVGRTPNHHACFEMLGNFSFGDYFKNEAIQWAAEFMLDPEKGLGLEKERLSVTVYGGNAKLGIKSDEEAIAAWKLHAPWLKDEKAPGGWRIYEYGDHDNYWPADAPEQGPNGPSGPCSEIYFDMFPNQGAPERVAESRDPFRYCEIWNLVFTQFNRVGVGKLEPLPSRNIDTGSGLERVARVIQGKPNNYETDHLFPIVEAVSKLCGKAYGKEFELDRRMRRITDHVRFAVFAIAEGVPPSGADKRGSVVQKILRTAKSDGVKLGIEDNFLCQVAKVVFSKMSVGYPELINSEKLVLNVIQNWEEHYENQNKHRVARLDTLLFLHNLIFIKRNPSSSRAKIFTEAASALNAKHFDVWLNENAYEPLEDDFAGAHIPRLRLEWIRKQFQCQGTEELLLPGDVAFELIDRLGMDQEHILDECAERNAKIDMVRLNKLKDEKSDRDRRRSAMASAEIFQSGPIQTLKAKYAQNPPTHFEGYNTTVVNDAKIVEIVEDEVLRKQAVHREAFIILDRTPFYAEGGGQVSDRGIIQTDNSLTGKVNVVSVKREGNLILHRIEGLFQLKVGDTVTAIVEDEDHRRPTQRNHSATHLLHHALRKTLGSHVEQRGSLVAPDRLRFDFTHFEAITPEQLQQIESCVNHLVRHDEPVKTAEKPIAEAKAMGAMALFGEKYGDVVRVVQMGPSTELCGGTHVGRTGEIGYFRIVSEGSVSAGVRRIEAFTGQAAVEDARAADTALATVAAQLKTKRDGVLERLKALSDEKAALERELESFKKKAANAAAGDLLSSAKEVKGAKLVAASLDGQDANGLRTTLDGIRKKLPEGAVVLGGTKDGKVALLVSLSPELVKRGGHAGNLLKELAPKVGGKGGGKPDMAQGGGTDASKLPEALSAAEILLSAMLK